MNNNLCNLSLFLIKPESRIKPYDDIIQSLVFKELEKARLNILAIKEIELTEFIVVSFQPVMN